MSEKGCAMGIVDIKAHRTEQVVLSPEEEQMLADLATADESTES
ncbi:hypothetical protein ACWY4P_52775 [Streptomyces sp. LZ34]